MVYAIQNKGSRPGQGHIRIGPKYPMTEFEGAILMGQLPGAASLSASWISMTPSDNSKKLRRNIAEKSDLPLFMKKRGQL
jgi:hypothetical protein